MIKNQYVKYAVFMFIGVLIALFFIPQKIKEVRNSEDIKTIENMQSEIKTITSKYMVLKNNFKEHCITTTKADGSQIIDCKRESETNQNAQTQSQTTGLTTQQIQTQTHSEQYSLTKPAYTLGIGPSVMVGRKDLFVGGMVSGQFWRLEPVLSVMYNTKNPDLLGQIAILVH